MEKNSLDEICALIRNHKSAIVFAHVFPDPDAIGSAVGLALGLNKLGIKAKAHVEVIPRMQEFVPAELVVNSLDSSLYDLAIIVDTANRDRVAAPEFKLKTVNIDHHKSNTHWADYNYIASTAPSSSVIVMQILQKLGLSEFGSEIANLLFAGLSDDTGSFRFSNSTSLAFEVAADLLRNGASPAKISNSLYHSNSASRIKLQALALQDLRFFHSGRVALITLPQELLDRCGATADDTDGLIDIARSVQGVEVAVFIRENKDKWKVSLRSKSAQISVDTIAANFGGGGHVAAAGCTLIGELAEVEAKILEAIKKEL